MGAVETLLHEAGAAGDRGEAAGNRVAAGSSGLRLGLLLELTAGLSDLSALVAADGHDETEVWRCLLVSGGLGGGADQGGERTRHVERCCLELCKWCGYTV